MRRSYRRGVVVDSRSGQVPRSRDRPPDVEELHPAGFRTPSRASVTTAEIAERAAQLIAGGPSAATARQAVATIRAIFEHAIADDRVARNTVAKVEALQGSAAREGQAMTGAEVWALADACREPLSDVVVVLAYTGLR
jgi:site-specific recombinase XerD